MKEREDKIKTIKLKYSKKLNEAKNPDMVDDCHYYYQEELKENGLSDYEDYYYPDEEDNFTGLAFLGILTLFGKYRFKMLDILEHEFKLKHAKGGRKPKLSFDDMLLATVAYLEPYGDEKINYAELAKKYNIHESNMYDTINWVKSIFEKYKLITEETFEEFGYKTFYYINIKKLNRIKL